MILLVMQIAPGLAHDGSSTRSCRSTRPPYTTAATTSRGLCLTIAQRMGGVDGIKIISPRADTAQSRFLDTAQSSTTPRSVIPCAHLHPHPHSLVHDKALHCGPPPTGPDRTLTRLPTQLVYSLRDFSLDSPRNDFGRCEHRYRLARRGPAFSWSRDRALNTTTVDCKGGCGAPSRGGTVWTRERTRLGVVKDLCCRRRKQDQQGGWVKARPRRRLRSSVLATRYSELSE